MYIMKPFNLEAAKAGAKVQTRDGRDVRLICFDVKGGCYPIVGVVTHKDGTETAETFTEKGFVFNTGKPAEMDLFMVEQAKEEVTKKSVKPFDAILAKKGAKVQTRDGRVVEIYSYGGANEYFPIKARWRYQGDNVWVYHTYTLDGFAYGRVEESDLDLVIVDEGFTVSPTFTEEEMADIQKEVADKLQKEFIEDLKKELVPAIIEEVKNIITPKDGNTASVTYVPQYSHGTVTASGIGFPEELCIKQSVNVPFQRVISSEETPTGTITTSHDGDSPCVINTFAKTITINTDFARITIEETEKTEE